MQEKLNAVLSRADFLKKTHILYKKDGTELSVNIRICEPEDLNGIMKLQRKVYDNIADKDTFVLTTEEELQESLIYDLCLGAFTNDIMIAFTLMVINRYSPRNLGYYLNYDEKGCSKCVTNDTTFVDPDYNGFGLQRFFIGPKEDIAIKLGALEVFATVSPDNVVSLNNVLSSGFEIVTEKAMYGGFKRYILRKRLGNED